MYHPVSVEATEDWGPWQYALTSDKFEQQIVWLSQHCFIVSLDALVAYLCGDAQLPEDAVVLTFDDAYRDFVDQALPILRECDVPATLYVPTALMSDGTAPYEFRLATTLRESDEVTFLIGEREHTYRPTTTTAVREAYAELCPLVEALSVGEGEAFLRRNDVAECPAFEVLSPKAVRDLGDERLVTVGSHGHHHRRLGTVPRETVEQEVATSRSQFAAFPNSASQAPQRL
jgi:peptidoglycan/xylan/chitin deacetylase (PgdA/CDA1 family)